MGMGMEMGDSLGLHGMSKHMGCEHGDGWSGWSGWGLFGIDDGRTVQDHFYESTER